MASLGVALNPATGTFDPNDLEVVGVYQMALRPHTPNYEKIVLLGHLDEISADPAKYVNQHVDSAYGALLENRGAVKYDTAIKVFGAASAYIGVNYTQIFAPFDPRYNNLLDFTMDARIRHNSVATSGYLMGEMGFMGLDGRWFLYRSTTELLLRTFDSAGAFHDLPTSGLGLLADTFYEYRVTYHGVDNDTSEVSISVDGDEIVSVNQAKLLHEFTGPDYKRLFLSGPQNASGMSPSGDPGYYEEWIIYPAVLPPDYTPLGAAIAPFSTTSPTDVITGDSGVANTIWDMSTLTSLVLTNFTGGALRVRVNADNNNTPSFSGPLLTLAQAQGLANLVGRYPHVEVSFISDGNTQVALHPMEISGQVPVAIPSTPTITGVNDATGTSATITIDGDSGATNYVYYKKVENEEWTQFGSRVGDGDIVVTGLEKSLYDFIGISLVAGVWSLFSNQIELMVSTSDLDDPLLGSSSKDLTFIEKKIAETYLTFQARYSYHALKSLDDQPHETNVYGETDYEDSLVLAEYYDPVPIPLVVKLDPEQDLLDRFGLDEPVEALAVASQKVMRDTGIAPKIGDRFDFNEWQFEIKTCKIGSWFSNAKTPCEWIFTVDKVHASGTSS